MVRHTLDAMGRREWVWATGSGLVLLLAAWVSGAGSITALSRPPLRPEIEDRADGFDEDVTDTRPPRIDRSELSDEDPLLTTILMWTLRALLVLIVATLAYFVIRALLRRLGRTRLSLKDDVGTDVLPDVLAAAVRDSEAQLDRGSSSEAVINAWLALERTAVAVGIDDDRARTPAELVMEVLGRHAVDRDAIERLAALYRQARFSVHPIGEEHREAARRALGQVRDELTPSGVLGEQTHR